MKKLLKGFTLLELIIVMAILVILMAAIMQMFKPIRETYVDATLYESRRTTQNGIIQYISESVRYASDLGVYNDTDISSAVNKFATEYHKKNPGIAIADVEKNAEVIIIDNTVGVDAYKFNGHDHIGRVLRRKNVGDSSLNETLGSGCRLALGAAYYGDNDFAIKLSKPAEDTSGLTDPDEIAKENADWSADEGIKITVASTATYGNRSLQENEEITDDTGVFNSKLVTTEGLILCTNLSKTGGLFDVLKDASLGGGGGGGGGSPSPVPGSGYGDGPSSKKDAENFGGFLSDDTVGAYVGGGGSPSPVPGGGGGTPPAADTEEYDSSLANVPGSKIYIVYLND